MGLPLDSSKKDGGNPEQDRTAARKVAVPLGKDSKKLHPNQSLQQMLD